MSKVQATMAIEEINCHLKKYRFQWNIKYVQDTRNSGNRKC